MAAPQWSGRASELELANGGSESAGPSAPGEGTARVQVGPGTTPNLKDWTAVAVPQNWESADQKESGRLGYATLKALAREVPTLVVG